MSQKNISKTVHSKFLSVFGISDYVSFIKKALVLTQRFPLIQRIDIVLVPQHGGFDEQDSGYVNGDATTSPTHEDWLKTTDEERAARMRAQVKDLDGQVLFPSRTFKAKDKIDTPK